MTRSVDLGTALGLLLSSAFGTVELLLILQMLPSDSGLTNLASDLYCVHIPETPAYLVLQNNMIFWKDGRMVVC